MRSGMRRLLWILTACLILLTGTLLVRAEGELFSDVPYDSWFYEDVMALTDSGVIGGYPDGTYRPSKNVTTGEALKMILLASGYPEPEQVSSHWARGYLNFAIDQGFLTRYEDISDLDVPMTRGLVAKLAANALGLTADGVAGAATLAAMGISETTAASAVTTAASGYASEVELLARLIHGEARGEPYVGMVAVGAVVLNRVKSSRFPNTMAGVIYQSGAFDAVSDGQINLAPSEQSRRAARDAMNGWDPTGGCLYYYNPATATSSWIWSREVRLTIGDHSFAI